MTTTQMRALTCVAVGASGATVMDADGRRQTIGWDALADSCVQDDPAACYYRGIAAPPQDHETRQLARAYRILRDQAHRMVVADRTLPIRLILSDQTNTGLRWELTARTVDGGTMPLPVGASEGGTMYWAEAQSLRDEVAERMRKQGYVDVANA